MAGPAPSASTITPDIGSFRASIARDAAAPAALAPALRALWLVGKAAAGSWAEARGILTEEEQAHGNPASPRHGRAAAVKSFVHHQAYIYAVILY
jgi:hypothetical protein